MEESQHKATDTLGERIKQLRHDAGLSKAGLARLVGVSDVSVHYWESGIIQQIGHERLLSLSNALGCTVDYLLAGNIEQKHLTDVINRLKDAVKNSEEVKLTAEEAEQLLGIINRS